MTGIVLDEERQTLRRIHRDLLEWGRWSMHDGGLRLGYTSLADLTRTRGMAVDRYDIEAVERVEFAWTTWRMVTMAQQPSRNNERIEMLQFILRVHYCENGHVMDKVHHTARKFRRPVSRSLYYVRLKEAKLALATLIY